MTTTSTVKFIEEDGDWFIEGLIMPVGGPLGGNDFTGSHFPAKKNWDYAAAWFPNGGRPGLYAHGFDEALGLSVIGREIKSWKDAKGVWLRAQIDKAHEYAAEIKQLLDEGLISLSSGAVDHLVKINAKSGEIQVWPWVEWSLVPNPAHPEAVVYQVKSADAIAHLAVIGTEPPDAVKDVAAEDELPPEPEGEPDEQIAEQPADVADEAIKMSTAEMGQMMMAQMVSAVTGALTPQALHDAAKASGASCEPMGEMEAKSEPAPLLAVAGKSAETEPAIDLDALQARLSAKAVAVAKELLG